MSLDSISPVSPPAPYLGGKRILAKTIVERINAIEHRAYAEPFVGMGGVFFRRTQKPRAEYINDISGDVVTLFRILQRHYPQFMETMRFQITSRREFERLVATDPTTLTDLERAARFLFLQKTAYGAKVSGKNFGVDRSMSGRFNLNRLGAILEDVHERLAGVTIEQLPWQDFIARYDTPQTLFYCDPPYWGCENDYGRNLFSGEDFDQMAGTLRGLKGRFLLSINDVPEIRSIFADFDIEPVECHYSISGGRGKRVGELIISG